MSLKISIVTICYNEAASIVSTMESVLAQTYRSIEYIIKDGGSTDGTVGKIREYANQVKVKGEGEQRNLNAHSLISTVNFDFRWYSEKDGGLYKGMNAGLAKCTGDYVLFCNAGDRFAANDVIEKMVAKAEVDGLPDLVYGDCASEVSGKLMVRTAHGPQFMRFGMPAAHESMLYKMSLIRQLGLWYDVSYRIAADYKFTYQFVKASKAFAYVPAPVVVFAEGGVSTDNKWKGLMETCRVRKEVSGLSFASRLTVFAMQCGALFLSTFAAPLYRAIRLKRIRR